MSSGISLMAKLKLRAMIEALSMVCMPAALTGHDVLAAISKGCMNGRTVLINRGIDKGCMPWDR